MVTHAPQHISRFISGLRTRGDAPASPSSHLPKHRPCACVFGPLSRSHQSKICEKCWLPKLLWLGKERIALRRGCAPMATHAAQYPPGSRRCPPRKNPVVSPGASPEAFSVFGSTFYRLCREAGKSFDKTTPFPPYLVLNKGLRTNVWIAFELRLAERAWHIPQLSRAPGGCFTVFVPL